MLTITSPTNTRLTLASDVATAVGNIAWQVALVDRQWRLARVEIAVPRIARVDLDDASEYRDDEAGNEAGDLNDDLANRFRAWSQGEVVDFADIPIACAKFSDFRRRVTDGCRQIPWGATMTYGELARRVGRPGAARAVGRVMASNPLPIVVPCHRVLASNGQLRGFSAPGGLTTKQRFLDLERA